MAGQENGNTKINQDSFFIFIEKKMNSYEFEYIFGVFDGHGKDGHLVSEKIKKFFDFWDLSTISNILSTFFYII